MNSLEEQDFFIKLVEVAAEKENIYLLYFMIVASGLIFTIITLKNLN